MYSILCMLWYRNCLIDLLRYSPGRRYKQNVLSMGKYHFIYVKMA